MSDGSASNRRLSHQLKRFQIVNAIRQHKLVSRQALSDITNLDAPLISRLTRELIQENVLEEVGKGDATSTGRRPIWLSLKKNSRYLIGVDLGAYETKAVLANLESEVISRQAALTYRGTQQDVLSDFIVQIIEKLLKDAGVGSDEVEGIGIAAAGVIDPDVGEVVFSCNLPAICHLKLVDILKERFGVPTEICNSEGVWGLTECERINSQQQKADFVMVHAGMGLCLSFLIDGKAVIGRSAKAKTDFGHITYDPKGPVCTCGSRGCLEAFAAGWAIARDAQASPSESLLDLVNGEVSQITAKEVFDAAIRGDYQCLSIVRQAGEILGETVSRFLEFFSPREVIFSGQLVTNSSPYYDALLAAVGRGMTRERYERMDFRVTALDKYAGAVGVTQLLAHDILHAPVKDMIRIGW